MAVCFIACWAGSWLTPVASGQPPTDAEPKKTSKPAPDDGPPELSLSALFHPDDKQDFGGELPATHWIDRDGAPSTLLVRRGQKWMQADLDQDGPTKDHEQPWPVVGQLAKQLKSLDKISDEQSETIANRAVTKMNRETDTVLVKIGKALAIASPDRPARWLTQDGATWKNATLDPTARRVAYTRDGDLFVVDVATGASMRLTDDADETLLDGILDWTYQEEIFGRGNYRGFWFSPDGNWLAMLRIDISRIEPYVLTEASSDRGSSLVRRYSKAGDPIPQAKLYLWDLRQAQEGIVPPARLVEESTQENEKLITGIWWHPRKATMLYAVSDRLQTWRELRRIDSSFLTGRSSTSDLVLREDSPAWIEPPTAPQWPDDDNLLWLSEVPSGYNRLYRVAIDGSIVRPASPDGLDVASFRVDHQNQHILVTGDQDRGTVDHYVYRIDRRDGTDAAARSTTDLVRVTTESGWHATEISPDGRWFVDQFSTPNQPPQVSVRSADGQRRMPIGAAKLKIAKPISNPELFSISTPDGIELPAMLVKPANAGPSSPVPVVIEVYGGPRAPVVRSRWGGKQTLYRELLARRGIATLVVDNRSSAGRGIADTWTIRGRVGEVEMKDVQSVADWIAQQPWADADRVAIRGWSFGGFLTLYAMTHSESFAAGIAGGSVTDWREYDSIYTERYMGLPQDNPDGYSATSLIDVAGDLHGELLMIHGEVDDNVHPSNTLRMAHALQNAGKDFRLMIYPGAAHSVGSGPQGWHMSQMIDRFLIETLTPDSSGE
ncbi:S9 family peptidase [Rubripirellula lacrimiformis]|nr:DPP IV N-terminal domain-containing protein [Rubripirellula lacrimiformis]